LTSPNMTSVDSESTAWRLVQDSTDPYQLEQFLNKFPAGKYAGAARIRLAALREPMMRRPVTPANDVSTLRGTLRNFKRKPLKSVLVRITRMDSKGEYTIKTNQKGEWSFVGLPVGAYQLAWVVDSREVKSGVFPLVSNKTMICDYRGGLGGCHYQ
jgi:hypothetical protein